MELERVVEQPEVVLVEPEQVGHVLLGELLEVQLGQVLVRELGRAVPVQGLGLELVRQVELGLDGRLLRAHRLELDDEVVGQGARRAEDRRWDPVEVQLLGSRINKRGRREERDAILKLSLIHI